MNQFFKHSIIEGERRQNLRQAGRAKFTVKFGNIFFRVHVAEHGIGPAGVFSMFHAIKKSYEILEPKYCSTMSIRIQLAHCQFLMVRTSIYGGFWKQIRDVSFRWSYAHCWEGEGNQGPNWCQVCGYKPQL